MVCIYCSSETRVTNSRFTGRKNTVWRRRLCKACGAVFTTHELPDLDSSLMVQYSSSIEAFHKNKLFISIYESLKHRPTALADAEALTSTVIGKLLREHKDRESAWPIASIIATTHKVLSNFDTVAATYYGAYFAKTK